MADIGLRGPLSGSTFIRICQSKSHQPLEAPRLWSEVWLKSCHRGQPIIAVISQVSGKMRDKIQYNMLKRKNLIPRGAVKSTYRHSSPQLARLIPLGYKKPKTCFWRRHRSLSYQVGPWNMWSIPALSEVAHFLSVTSRINDILKQIVRPRLESGMQTGQTTRCRAPFFHVFCAMRVLGGDASKRSREKMEAKKRFSKG